ncbi:MAG: non-homologous end-joining DNA ligase [Nocardioides sp.]|uniref:non-homologous end-joining DNA ligase n=1 Tax=Nocardioides sp. TaxID=35761 RepID=UPI003F00112F
MSTTGSEVFVDVEGRTLKLTNLEKVLYPATGTTKAEVLQYYAQVAPALLAQLGDRAVTRIRWPHGVAGESFFEKNAPAGTPSWVRTVEVGTTGSRTGTGTGVLRFPVCDDLPTLTWLANLSALELHVHQWKVSRTGRVRRPDRIVIDLDPGEPAGLHECAVVALMARDLLAERGLVSTPVASGSKGLHLYASLPRGTDAEGAVELAKEIAETMQSQAPSLVTATMTKARRAGKIFVDWSQNSASKTTLAPYSLRGRERPTAAAPLTWDEVAEGAEDELALEQFTFTQVLERLAEHGDLFAW